MDVKVEDTGIYLQETKDFTGDVDSLREELDFLASGTTTPGSLISAVMNSACQRLAVLGVRISEQKPEAATIPKGHRLRSTGTQWLVIPDKRPLSADPRGAAATANPPELNRLWKIEVERACCVISDALLLRNSLSNESNADAILHAFQLGRSVEALNVTEFEPLVIAGRGQRKAGKDSWVQSRDFRDARKTAIRRWAKKQIAAGRAVKEIAYEIVENSGLNRSNGRIAVKKLEYSSVLKYIQDIKASHN